MTDYIQNDEGQSQKPRRNMVLAVYTILTTTFISAYTAVQLLEAL